MKDPRVPSDTVSGQATVCPFPLQQILERRQAAGYLGVPARRLWLLERIGGGPRPVRHQDGVLRYRRDELDRYSSRQFERAGLPPSFWPAIAASVNRPGMAGLTPFWIWPAGMKCWGFTPARAAGWRLWWAWC